MTKFVTVNEEFPPRPGGVAQFAFDISHELAARNRLAAAISIDTLPADVSQDFELIHVPARRRSTTSYDKYWILRKGRSLCFRLRQEFDYRIGRRIERELQMLRESHGEIDVWLTYTVHNPELIARVLQKRQHKYWLLFHGLDLIGAKSAGLPIDEWAAAAERIVFNSLATQSLYSELGFRPAAKQSVLYPGVNSRRLLGLQQHTQGELFERYPMLKQAQLVVSTACRLVKRKGIDIAIQALAEDMRANREWYFIIVGTGPEEAHLRELVSRYGLDDQVIFTGFASEGLKLELLEHSDLFIMPNRSLGGTDFEGFGISFAEAALFNTCVIGGRHGGASEAVSHGETGFLVDADDDQIAIEEIRGYVETLRTDSDLRRQMAQVGKGRVLEEFDIGKGIEKLLNEADATIK